MKIVCKYENVYIYRSVCRLAEKRSFTRVEGVLKLSYMGFGDVRLEKACEAQGWRTLT